VPVTFEDVMNGKNIRELVDADIEESMHDPNFWNSVIILTEYPMCINDLKYWDHVKVAALAKLAKMKIDEWRANLDDNGKN
jgi:hypothetical protein